MAKEKKKTETFTTECKDLEQVKQCENSLCFDRWNPLIVQQTTSCNAARGWYGVNFSRASWETCQVSSELYPLAAY